jgi:PLD-like domain
MSTTFVTSNLWKQITKAACSRPNTAFVAVPYFSKSGHGLLPLREGSRLVVNASVAAVTSGQTSPQALLALQRKGVRIYSNANLHAKVYVFGTTAFIGSANASSSSESNLIEAVVRTGDRATVAAAREFVRGLCDIPLGPKELESLAKKYKDPRGGKGKRGAGRARANNRQRPVWIAQVSEDELEVDANEALEAGLKSAKKLKSKRAYVVEGFWCSRKTSYEPGDTLVEVFAQADGKIVVSPPGRILRVQRDGRRRDGLTFVYFERPDASRVSRDLLAKRLGHGFKKLLHQDGKLKDDDFRDRLLAYFDRRR